MTRSQPDSRLPGAQLLLACDPAGRFTGQYVRRDVAHVGDGQRHLAITVLLYDAQHRVLLQRRRHTVFDGVWDFTGATHLLHSLDGDETAEQATARCLEREYGIRDLAVRAYGAFEYFARDGDLCEHEYCVVLAGEYNGEVRLNAEVGYGFRWVDKLAFQQEIAERPERFSPWAAAGTSVLKRGGFFETAPRSA